MLNDLLIRFGKILAEIVKKLNLGHGSTWPGHLALNVNPYFIEQVIKEKNIIPIIVAGTNGKTTTAKMLRTILEESGKNVFQNESGANLLNGIASSLILYSNILTVSMESYAIFEVDENTFPALLGRIEPKYIILLNLFRDQLDRYGEVDSIARNWDEAIKKLSEKTVLILNADDPEVAYIGANKHLQIYYFGLNGDENGTNVFEHAADSIYCPRCNNPLTYEFITLSHLGKWKCESCKLRRETLSLSESRVYPLSGTYNKYNTLAAVLLGKILKIPEQTVEHACKRFVPVFGRQEILTYNDKDVQIILSKNPTGFNENLRTIIKLNAKHVLLILNDNIPDGQDVSWIWDIDTEIITKANSSITISGTRAYDMGLRIKYSAKSQMANRKSQKNEKFKIFENIRDAIDESIKGVNTNETLYILPTYTAMLEVRKIISGKKIL